MYHFVPIYSKLINYYDLIYDCVFCWQSNDKEY